jgi:hypothetical protein
MVNAPHFAALMATVAEPAAGIHVVDRRKALLKSRRAGTARQQKDSKRLKSASLNVAGSSPVAPVRCFFLQIGHRVASLDTRTRAVGSKRAAGCSLPPPFGCGERARSRTTSPCSSRAGGDRDVFQRCSDRGHPDAAVSKAVRGHWPLEGSNPSPSAQLSGSWSGSRFGVGACGLSERSGQSVESPSVHWLQSSLAHDWRTNRPRFAFSWKTTFRSLLIPPGEPRRAGTLRPNAAPGRGVRVVLLAGPRARLGPEGAQTTGVQDNRERACSHGRGRDHR